MVVRALGHNVVLSFRQCDTITAWRIHIQYMAGEKMQLKAVGDLHVSEKLIVWIKRAKLISKITLRH